MIISEGGGDVSEINNIVRFLTSFVIRYKLLLVVSFGRIYRRSLEITLRHKALWVVGMALVAFSGGGFNFFQSFRNIGDFSGSFSLPGSQTTTAGFNLQPFFNKLGQVFAGVSSITWILLVLAIILALVVGFALSLIARSWAKGALIAGIDAAYQSQEVTLRQSSERGIQSLRNILWLNIVPWLLYAFLIFLTAGILVFLIKFVAPLAIALGLVAGILALLAYFALAATQIWAERVVVIEGRGAREAFFEGWRLAKTHILKMLTLGFLNTLISCCLGCVIMSVFFPVLTFLVGLFAISPALGWVFLLPLLGVGLPLIFLSILFNGIYRVFNYSTWNLLYRQIRQAASVEVMPDDESKNGGPAVS